MGGISLSRAALISIVVQALIYGVYAVLFGFTQWIIFNKRQRSFNKPLWFASILMFLIATAHLSVDSSRIMTAFLYTGNSSAASDAFLEALNEPSFVAKSALYQIQTYIGDACIIYRTYILYGQKSWVVAAPALLYVLCLVTGSGMLNSFVHATPTSTPFDYAVWALPYVLGTLITNLICTSMIVVRILRMTHDTMQVRDVARFTPLLVIVESGAIYSASLLILAALSATSSNGYTIIIDQLCPIIGITFSMIIIRVHNEGRKPSPKLVDAAHQPFSPSGVSPGAGADILTQPQFTVTYSDSDSAYVIGGSEEKLKVKRPTLNTNIGPVAVDLRYAVAPMRTSPASGVTMTVTRGSDGWFRPLGDKAV